MIRQIAERGRDVPAAVAGRRAHEMTIGVSRSVIAGLAGLAIGSGITHVAAFANRQWEKHGPHSLANELGASVAVVNETFLALFLIV